MHGWDLDVALRKCVEVLAHDLLDFLHQTIDGCLSDDLYILKQPAHEKMGAVGAQWIAHQSVPSLGNQVKPKAVK